MKKILYITDNTIWGHGGGSLGSQKHYSALKKYCEKNNYELKVISLDKNSEVPELFPIKVSKNKFIDILVRLLGHSSYLYYTWICNASKILTYSPDILYLGRSRLGFIAKSFKKKLPQCKIIISLDNVEYDYVDSYFANEQGIRGKLKKKLEKRDVYRDEKLSVLHNDNLIFLSQRDYKRYQELYSYNNMTPIIIPVCIDKPEPLIINSKKTVAFIGSLDYQANNQAVKKIINSIWIPYFSGDSSLQLIIAGKNPSEELEILCQQSENIILIKNFKTLADFMPKETLIIAPIEKGAGMKVKVAEALGMGLMIAASDEALVGYEKALENNNNIFRCNSNEEYIDAIKIFKKKSDDEIKTIFKDNNRLFERFYSRTVSNYMIKGLCEDILNK